MFSTPIFDVAIALFFTYFLLSVVVSAINEVIMSVLKMRAKMLKQTILNMLNDPKWKELSQEIIKSPIIDSLKEKENSFPSYISKQTFTEALKYAADVKGIFKITSSIEFKDADENNPTIKMFKVFADSSKDIAAFEEKIENLFNGAMDRVRGWYKRRVQNIIFIVALLVVVILNADTINIVNILWKNPVVAEATASRISYLFQSNEESPVISFRDTTKTNLEKLNEAYSLLDELPFPIGWHSTQISPPPENFFGWASKIIGILITSFAVTLGAPFWFDILNKLINLRSTGNKPDEGKK